MATRTRITFVNRATPWMKAFHLQRNAGGDVTKYSCLVVSPPNNITNPSRYLPIARTGEDFDEMFYVHTSSNYNVPQNWDREVEYPRNVRDLPYEEESGIFIRIRKVTRRDGVECLFVQESQTNRGLYLIMQADDNNQYYLLEDYDLYLSNLMTAYPNLNMTITNDCRVGRIVIGILDKEDVIDGGDTVTIGVILDEAVD